MTTSSTYTAIVVDFRHGQGEVNWEQLEVLPNWTPVITVNGTADKPVFELTTIGDLFLVGYPTCVRCGSLIHPKNAVYLEGAYFCTECGQRELDHMQYRADKFATELARVRESFRAVEDKLRKDLEEMERETREFLNKKSPALVTTDDEGIPF